MENQPLPFLSLPTEIRLNVYKLVLKKHNPIQLSTSRQFARQTALDGEGKIMQFNRYECQDPNTMALEARKLLAIPQIPQHTALLSTCRQINAEATPVLVAVNMIVFETRSFAPLGDQRWIRTIMPIFRHLKRLTLWINTPAAPPVKQMAFYQRRAPLLNRMTILFQTDVWIDLQRKANAKELTQFWLAFKQSPRKSNTVDPNTVDVGYYPTVQHAFEAMSNDYRYEHR